MKSHTETYLTEPLEGGGRTRDLKATQLKTGSNQEVQLGVRTRRESATAGRPRKRSPCSYYGKFFTERMEQVHT